MLSIKMVNCLEDMNLRNTLVFLFAKKVTSVPLRHITRYKEVNGIIVDNEKRRENWSQRALSTAHGEERQLCNELDFSHVRDV
jgi:hypothetical protein